MTAVAPTPSSSGVPAGAEPDTYDVVVVGGGPAGATAADDLARGGWSVLLLDKAGRIKPCGGAIPPRAIHDFAIPDHLLCAKIGSARMISPKDKTVDMPIDGGFVGMVDRGVFDEWLRERAERNGATRRAGTFESLSRVGDWVQVHYEPKDAKDQVDVVRARLVIGADGARSAVARLSVPNADKVPCVFAYHEIVKSPEADSPAVTGGAYAASRCDVYYQGKLSPDFYAWVFPHGATASIGTGSANKGFSLRGSVADLRRAAGLDHLETVRREGAPIPLKPLKRWDNGRDVILAGDAAGVVAPASGEGIYYAMLCGRLAAEATAAALQTDTAKTRAKALAGARKAFMKEHGRVFLVLGIMQHFWYRNDKRRESFVKICEDKDVQSLTWQAYMHKKLVRRKPMAHLRIFFKDMAHLMATLSPKARHQRATQR